MTLFMLNLTESMKFKLLIKTKMQEIMLYFALKQSDDVFTLLTNVKMPTILTFKSQIRLSMKIVL